MTKANFAADKHKQKITAYNRRKQHITLRIMTFSARLGCSVTKQTSDLRSCEVENLLRISNDDGVCDGVVLSVCGLREEKEQAYNNCQTQISAEDRAGGQGMLESEYSW